MAQWIKHLPCRHEDLSSNPRTHVESDGVTPVCNPGAPVVR